MDKKDFIANMTQNYLDNCENNPDFRPKSSAFTRKRKLTPKRMLMILLQRLVCSLQLGLDRFCEHLEEETVSKQAFSKARANLNPEFVRKFADGIAEVHAQDPDAPSYCGMRLIAISVAAVDCPCIAPVPGIPRIVSLHGISLIAQKRGNLCLQQLVDRFFNLLPEYFIYIPAGH